MLQIAVDIAEIQKNNNHIPYRKGDMVFTLSFFIALIASWYSSLSTSLNVLYSLRIGGKFLAGSSTERRFTLLAVGSTLSADIVDDAWTSTSGLDVIFTCFSMSDESQSTVFGDASSHFWPFNHINSNKQDVVISSSLTVGSSLILVVMQSFKFGGSGLFRIPQCTSKGQDAKNNSNWKKNVLKSKT